jgi:FlaA1/EpsC-like NDP-sugar epimerase
MIRLFNVYYPTRTLVLLICEVLLVGGSFLLATACLLVPDGYVVLINELVYENGLLKIAGITALTLLLTYYFDLYGPRRTSASWEIYFRLLLVLSVLSFILAGIVYLLPDLDIGPYVLIAGVSLLTLVLVVWRWAYEWIIVLPIFRERVYVLGSGERARAVVELLRGSRDAGMEVVDWKEKAMPMDGLITSRRSCAPSAHRSRALTVSLSPWKTAANRCRCENCLNCASAA